MSDFERVESKQTQPSDPTLRISPTSASAYLSVGAVRAFFEDVDRVTFYVDPDCSRLAIVPEDGEHSYSLTKKSGSAGAHLATRKPLEELGVDVDDLEQAYSCSLSEDRETGYVVAEVADVVEAETDDVHCPECGKRFDEVGIKQHLSAKHDEINPQNLLKQMDPDEIGGTAPEGDDSWRDINERAEAGQ